MSTTVGLYIKTESETKEQAQEVAKKLGLSLSSLINAYLKQLIVSKNVHFSLSETPSDYLIATILRAQKNHKKGKSSPVFKDSDSALKWLKKQGVEF